MMGEVVPFRPDTRLAIVVEASGIVTGGNDLPAIGRRAFFLTISGGEFDGLVVGDYHDYNRAMGDAAYWAAEGYRIRDLTGGAR
jgi:hypothetical protein